MNKQTAEHQPSENSLLAKLEGYLIHHDIPRIEFYDDLAKKLCFSYTSHFQSRLQLKKHIDSLPALLNQCEPGLESRKFLHLVRTLNLVYGVDYLHFGVPKELIQSDLLKAKLGRPGRNLVPLETDLSKTSNKIDFDKKYFNALETPLSGMSFNLIVFEYLEQLEYKDPLFLDLYYTVHTRIYGLIEEKLKADTNFKYTRFLSLPIHDQLSRLNNTYYNAEEYDLLLNAILKLTSVPLLQHICNCMEVYDRRFKETHTGFFLVAKAPRAYQWGIIDDGKYLVSEYYRYTKDNKCKPDLLFLEGTSEESLPIFESYMAEANSLASTKRPDKNPRIQIERFRKDKILACLRSLKIEAESFVDSFDPKKRDDENLEFERATAYLQKIQAKIQVVENSNLPLS